MTADPYESLIEWLEKSWYGVAESEHLRPLSQWLIPGLITNVAYFRHQLEAVS